MHVVKDPTQKRVNMENHGIYDHKRRLAKGEITKKEYDRLKDELEYV